VTFNNIDVVNFSGNGIIVGYEANPPGDLQNVHITNCLISNIQPGYSHGFGIYVGYESEGFNYVPPKLTAHLDYTGLLIENNEITNTKCSGLVLQSITASTGTLQVLNNYIHDITANSGIWLDCARNVLIDDNIVDSNVWGIEFSAYAESWYTLDGPYSPQNVTLTNNQITNSTEDGIAIYNGWPATITIEDNAITGNDPGMSNYLTTAVDASPNWWGDTTGPYQATTNTDGLGDTISDYVIYDPWWAVYMVTLGTNAPVINITQGTTYTAIQAAINDADPGDEIHVAAGTYTEALYINIDLTLVGAGRDVTFIHAPATLPSYSWNSTCNSLLAIDNCTAHISGFTIDGLHLGNGGGTYIGVHFWKSSGSLTYCKVTGFRDNPLGGAQDGIGVFVNHDWDVEILHSVNIAYNIVEDYQKGGIVVNEWGASFTIDHNTIIGQGPMVSGQAAQNGIQIGYSAGGSITYNTITDNYYVPDDWSAAAILLVGVDGVTISDNNIASGNDIGIDLSDDAYYGYGGSVNIVVTDNKINGCEIGLQVATNSTATTLTDNEFTNNPIQVYGNTSMLSQMQTILTANTFDNAVLITSSARSAIPVIYSSIQAAIDASTTADGDILSIYPGTYDFDEANNRDMLTGGSGSSNFNIFVNKSITLQGVDDSGNPINDYNDVAAYIIPKRNTPLGNLSTIFVQTDNVTITGLDITAYNDPDYNFKTISIIGDNVTIKDCKIHALDQVSCLYMYDPRYVPDTSHIQSYRFESNYLDVGGIYAAGIRMSSGTGWSGNVANRVITDNDILAGSYGIQFVGPNVDGWDVYPIGAATISANRFSSQDKGSVVAWGKYGTVVGYGDLDWDGIFNGNTFDKAVYTKTSTDDVRYYDAGSFYYVRGIYSAIQRYPINVVAQPGDNIIVAPAVYNETINLNGKSDITITGITTARSDVIIKPSTTLPWNALGYTTTRQCAIRIVNSSNIVIDNITLDCELIKNNGYHGVLYANSTGGVIKNSTLKNMYNDQSHYYDIMIYARAIDAPYTCSSKATLSILSNKLIDTGRVGLVTHDYIHSIVDGNEFYKTTYSFGYGMEIGSSSTAEITDNEIHGFSASAVTDGSSVSGIYIENAYTSSTYGTYSCQKPVTISNNEIYNCQNGLVIGNQWDGFAGDVDIVVDIEGNNIHDNFYSGLTIADEDKENGSSVTVNLTDNIITTSLPDCYYAIFAYTDGDGDLSLNLQQNTITSYYIGLVVYDFGANPATSEFDLSITDQNTFDELEYAIYTGAVNWNAVPTVSGNFFNTNPVHFWDEGTLDLNSYLPPANTFESYYIDGQVIYYEGSVFAKIKVLLQGPYVSGGTMTHLLADNSYIPLISPYDAELVLTALPDVSPKYIVDWIWLELRSSATGPSEQGQSCFLLEDGTVVDVTGNPVLQFTGSTNNSFYVIVRHRNHLAIMSSGTHAFSSNSGTAPTIDLTALGSVYGGDGLGAKVIESGILALFSGDANGNGSVQNDDIYNVLLPQLGYNGYYMSDLNLNSYVQNTDLYSYELPNIGKSNQIPAGSKASDAPNIVRSSQVSNKSRDVQSSHIGKALKPKLLGKVVQPKKLSKVMQFPYLSNPSQ